MQRLLTCAGNQDRRSRSLNRWRGDMRVDHVPALAGERDRLRPEHVVDDLQRLLESALTLGDRPELHAELGELIRVPADAQAEHDPAVADPVEIGRHPGQHCWLAVEDAIDDRAELDVRGAGSEVGEVQPRLDVVTGMIANEEAVEPDLLGQQSSLDYALGRIRVVRQGKRLYGETNVVLPRGDPGVRGPEIHHRSFPSCT